MSTSLSNLATAEKLATKESRQEVGAASSPCMKPLEAIEIAIVNPERKPVAEVTVELTGPAGRLTSISGPDGLCRFDGLDPGSYQLTLPDIDQNLWKVAQTQPLSAKPTPMPKAPWHPSPEQVVPTDVAHNVKQGDSITSIAQAHGQHPDVIWDAPANKALRDLRKQMHVLFPGDVVLVPKIVRKVVQAQASQRVSVTLERKLESQITVQFMDEAGNPRSGLPYIVKIENKRGHAIEALRGQTDASGTLREPAPLDAERATIFIDPEGAAEKFELALGDLDPADTVSGAQGRLQSLGFDCGAIDGTVGPKTQAALLEFQVSEGLAPSGKLCTETIAAIEQAYGH